MLDRDAVDEVCRLLAQGDLTQAEIAARAGCSRETVSAIKTGRRPVLLRPVQLRQSPDRGQSSRCMLCGATIDGQDCFACQVRRHPVPAADPRDHAGDAAETGDHEITYDLGQAQERRRREIFDRRRRRAHLRHDTEGKTP